MAVTAGRIFSEEFIQSLWSLFLAVALTPAHGKRSRNTFFALLFPSQEAAMPMAGLRDLRLRTHLAETSRPSCQPGPMDQHKPIPRDSHQAAPSHSSYLAGWCCGGYMLCPCSFSAPLAIVQV